MVTNRPKIQPAWLHEAIAVPVANQAKAKQQQNQPDTQTLCVCNGVLFRGFMRKIIPENPATLLHQKKKSDRIQKNMKKYRASNETHTQTHSQRKKIYTLTSAWQSACTS